MFIFIVFYALHIALQANLILLTETEVMKDGKYEDYLAFVYIFVCIIIPTIVIFVTDLKKDIKKSIKNSIYYVGSVAFGTLHCLMIFKEYQQLHTMIISTATIMAIILTCINKHVAIAKCRLEKSCVEDPDRDHVSDPKNPAENC